MQTVRILWTSLCVLFWAQLPAQVEHNFDRDPENTNCHLIPKELSADSLIASIHRSTFRLAEEVSISRYSEPQALSFHSCDGQTGFLLVVYTGRSAVYRDILFDEWKELLASDDIREAFKIWKEQHTAEE